MTQILKGKNDENEKDLQDLNKRVEPLNTNVVACFIAFFCWGKMPIKCDGKQLAGIH